MRRPRAWLLALLLVAARPAAAAEAEQHFSTGVKLFQAQNFSGALAEFEESYRLRPSASSLQNIALCQRALFRYVEATDSLERMLREHADAVDPEDARAARATIEELRSMVAVVTVSIEPPDATLTIDGRAVPGAGERTVRLNVGEHRLVAEAPRRRRYEQLLAFAGGPRAVSVKLEGSHADLTVVAEDSEAAIAIDGVPRSFGAWTGEVLAGERHTIQVYRSGYTTATEEVTLGQDERRTVRVPLGPPTKDPNATTPFPYTPPPAPPQRRGVYGLLTSTGYVLNPDPAGFRLPGTSGRDGSYFGLRVGYRFTNVFGLEAMGEFGKHTIGPGCYTPPDAPASCDTAPADGATYEFSGQRFGTNARFMTGGDRFRFMAAAGVGGAYHRLSLRLLKEDGRIQGGSAALNAYLFAEAGVELSFGPALIGGVIALAVDGINNLTIGGGAQRAYSDARNITMAGLGLRLGYAHW